MKETKQTKQEILTLGKFIEICQELNIPMDSEIKVNFEKTIGMGYKDGVIYLKGEGPKYLY